MDEYIGIIKLFAGGYAPKGWAPCNGQVLRIDQNTALYSILGSTYGGNGQTTFALPDLRGRVALGAGGQGPGLSDYAYGQSGGTEWVTLDTTHIPAHKHLLRATAQQGDTGVPSDAFLASTDDEATFTPGVPLYNKNPASTTTMAPGSIGATGGSQPHSNMQPYLGLSYIICVQGVFPHRP